MNFEKKEPSSTLLKPLSLFVTGTDTNVGKTRVCTALMRHFVQQGWHTAGFKPVAAGWDAVDEHGRPCNSDALQLQQNSHPTCSLLQINPCSLESACAPHIAAKVAGVDIELQSILQAYAHLQRNFDVLVVEGAGGFCVPLSQTVDDNTGWGMDDLALALNLPVLLVVGIRLGCINHALLTAQAIAAKGLKLAGWIGNQGQPEAMSHAAENHATLMHLLRHRHGAPCWGTVSFGGDLLLSVDGVRCSQTPHSPYRMHL